MIEKSGDGFTFLRFEYLTYRNAQFLSVNAFCNGERKGCKLLVAFLFVWRDRIVHVGLYAVTQQIVFKFVASVTQYREDVEHAALPIFERWQLYVSVAYIIYIIPCVVPTLFVFRVNVFKLHGQDGCVQLVHTAVYADV